MPQSSLNTWSCLACKRRKVRCDRKSPCANCVRRGTECSFPTSGRVPRRPDRHTQSRQESETSQKVQLIVRLRRLESLLDRYMPINETDEKSTESANFIATPVSSRSTVVPTLKSQPASKTLRPKRSKITEDQISADERDAPDPRGRFWYTIREEVSGSKCDEVGSIRNLLEDEDEDSDPDSEPNATPRLDSLFSEGSTSFPFAASIRSDDSHADPLGPPPSQLPFLWKTYQDNIDPFVKVLHTPTVAQALRHCNFNMNALSSSMQAMIISVSFAAAVSLSNEEVQSRFRMDKATLVAQYRASAERAFDRADLLNTTDITILQALTIFLTVLCNEEPMRYVWCMTGLLIRLAVTLNVHREHAMNPPIGPFDAEIRRRIWWHICILDARAGDNRYQGFLISESMFDARPPANINDTDIRRDIPGPVVERTGPTDVTVSIDRCELWRLSRVIRAPVANTYGHEFAHNQRLRLIYDYRQSRVMNPLSMASGNREIDSYTRMSLILVTNRFELIASYRFALDNGRDPSHDPHMFRVAVDVLTQISYLTRNPATARFAWINRGCVQWQALGVILSHIISRPWEDAFEKGWLAICRHVEEIPEATQHELLWAHFQQLMNQAGRRRDEFMVSQWSIPTQGAPELAYRPAIPASILRSQTLSTGTLGPSQQRSYPEVHALSPVATTISYPTASEYAHATAFFDALSASAMSTDTMQFMSGNYTQPPLAEDNSWLFTESTGGGWVTQWPQEMSMDWEQWNKFAQEHEHSAFWGFAGPG